MEESMSKVGTETLMVEDEIFKERQKREREQEGMWIEKRFISLYVQN